MDVRTRTGSRRSLSGSLDCPTGHTMRAASMGIQTAAASFRPSRMTPVAKGNQVIFIYLRTADLCKRFSFTTFRKTPGVCTPLHLAENHHCRWILAALRDLARFLQRLAALISTMVSSAYRKPNKNRSGTARASIASVRLWRRSHEEAIRSLDHGPGPDHFR